MSINNNTTKHTKKQYKHLTKEQRTQIEILINIKDNNGKRIYNNSYIAEKIGVHKSIVSRELKKRIKSKVIIMSGKVKNKP